MTDREKSRVGIHLRQAAELRNLCLSLGRARRVPVQKEAAEDTAGAETNSRVREEPAKN